MILYLDTSALVKLFVDESGSDEVLSWAAEATAVACSHLGYPEAVSAVSRRLRTGSLARATYDRVLDELERRWADVVTVALDERLAGELARRHPLSGADAVHLAAALALHEADLPVAFCGFDRPLNEAAAAESLRVLRGTEE
ncbi:MAG: type II toxin-antitoxin system VapC family toxin [Thermoleophilia bacterium]